MCVVLGKTGLIHTLTAMHGAIVAQEQRKVGFCDSETSNGRSKRAKTLANEAKYSTNRGLMYDLLPRFAKKKSNN